MVPGSLSPHAAISVVMATYNGELYLEEQLNSILSQTMRPDKIIVCDDHSSDSTTAILEKYAQENPSLVYFVNEVRLGVIENFKKAVSLADASGYLALSDQDDIWMQDKLAKLYEKIIAIDDGSKPAMVYSDLLVIDNNKKILNRSFWNELGQDGYEHCFETLLFGNFVTGCTVLMNQQMRPYFAAMPSDVLMHDAWLALAAFSVGNTDSIKTPLVSYRRHHNNLAFVNTYRKKNQWERIIRHARLLLFPNDYLADQLQLVQKFNNLYGKMLSKEKAAAVAVFLGLQNRSYLRKMMVFRSFFKTHWLKGPNS